MRSYSSSAAIMTMLGALLSAGCHRHPVVIAPAQPALASSAQEDPCWWTVLRTTLPPDSVAVHFQRGFAAVGLANATWAHSADTAWAYAGPTPLSRGPAGAVYASRVVAYLHGDSTHFRYYVSIAPTSLMRGSVIIPFCGEIATATDIPRSAPNWRRDTHSLDTSPVGGSHVVRYGAEAGSSIRSTRTTASRLTTELWWPVRYRPSARATGRAARSTNAVTSTCS